MNEKRSDMGVKYAQRSRLESPAVSVIIPVYNGEAYLEDCLRSVFAQSLRDVEIVLIDDASTDGTVELATRLLESSSMDYLLLTKTANRGVSHSRNVGIQAARGQYLFFLDSDDVLSENSLEILLENYRSECVPVLPVIRFKTNEELDNVSYSVSQEQRAYPTYKMIREFNHGYVWGFLIERELVQSKRILFDENLSYREDNVWLAWYMSFFPAVRRVSGAYYAYRVTPHSLSRRDPVWHTILAYRSVMDVLRHLERNDMSVWLSIRRVLYNSVFGESVCKGKPVRWESVKTDKCKGSVLRVMQSSLPVMRRFMEAVFLRYPRLEFILCRLTFILKHK